MKKWISIMLCLCIAAVGAMINEWFEEQAEAPAA